MSETKHSIQSNPSSLVTASAANVASSFPTNNSKKVHLFYYVETQALAEEIVAESDATELHSISWKKFPDGFPNIFIPNAQGIREQHIAFLASSSSPGAFRSVWKMKEILQQHLL